MCLLNLPNWPMGASMIMVVTDAAVVVVVAVLGDLVAHQRMERMHIQWKIEAIMEVVVRGIHWDSFNLLFIQVAIMVVVRQ
jgi:hypothetical protein